MHLNESKEGYMEKFCRRKVKEKMAYYILKIKELIKTKIKQGPEK